MKDFFEYMLFHWFWTNTCPTGPPRVLPGPNRTNLSGQNSFIATVIALEKLYGQVIWSLKVYWYNSEVSVLKGDHRFPKPSINGTEGLEKIDLWIVFFALISFLNYHQFSILYL